MFTKFALIFSIAIIYVQGRSRNALLEKETCDFDDSRKYYDSKDLLRCMNVLASYLEIREIDRSIKDEYNSRLHSGQDSSWTDLIVSLFNGVSNPGYQIPQFSDTVTNQYQSSQYQTTVGGLSGSSGGLNINLFEALYSISRYDDLKCVPRILCEMASGVTPGESIYGRDTNLFRDLFGNNVLLRLLTNFNFAESSPFLSFGKAALLGYTSKSNPRNCYQEYPRCPRNPDQLIHYLNNHNGGFFRFFNKLNHGNNPYARPYIVQNEQNQASSVEYGFKIGSDRTGMGELKFDTVAENDTRYYEPRIRNQLNRIVFPDEKRSKKFVDTSNRLPKSFDLEYNDTDDVQRDGSNFFPQQTREEKYEESNQLYTSSEPFLESQFKTFVFPEN